MFGRTNIRPVKNGLLRRCPLAIAQRLVHCAIALSTAVLDRVTKTMSVAPLLTNNLDNSKQKTSNLLSPAPPPYSWSLLGKVEGPAPPPSSKISWSFDLACNPDFSNRKEQVRLLHAYCYNNHTMPAANGHSVQVFRPVYPSVRFSFKMRAFCACFRSSIRWCELSVSWLWSPETIQWDHKRRGLYC